MASKSIITVAATLLAIAVPASATPFNFSTGGPDNLMATASRPGGSEIETADDFILSHTTTITSASFTGLMPLGSSPQQVIVEIYRVFPFDSNTARTSGSPLFSTPQVPTRVNSPSDVAFDTRDSATSTLSFSTAVISASFAALSSVQPGGIHPLPNSMTGGNGPITGEEVEFTVNFSTPLILPADHYFFVPQVALNSGDFYWLSAPKPIVAPGTPFAPDLQSWTRDEGLAPDWLRVGTDIVGGTAFNNAFSLTGHTATPAVPEPASLALVLGGFAGFARLRRRKG